MDEAEHKSRIKAAMEGLLTIQVIFAEHARDKAALLEDVRNIPGVQVAGWLKQSDVADDRILPPGGVMMVRAGDTDQFDSLIKGLGKVPIQKRIIGPVFGWNPQ